MDLTPAEFKATTLKLNMSNYAQLKATMEPFIRTTADAAPESFDWRDKGISLNVKDQGRCGACWAFSAVGNIEAQYALKKQQNATFSEQQLVDCDVKGGNQGCEGGLMDTTFQYIINNGGLVSDSDYPYNAADGTCKFNKNQVKVQLSSFKDISKNENEIKEVLFANGPLSVAVNADPFQFYTGGIFTPTTTSCDPQGLNHAVTLIGFGIDTKTNKQFWILKNSWGKNWGEKGYIRLARGIGACGINTNVSTAVLK